MATLSYFNTATNSFTATPVSPVSPVAPVVVPAKAVSKKAEYGVAKDDLQAVVNYSFIAFAVFIIAGAIGNKIVEFCGGGSVSPLTILLFLPAAFALVSLKFSLGFLAIRTILRKS